MRIALTACLLAALSAGEVCADNVTYYYRNGIKHALTIDTQRQVDLAGGSGTAPKIIAVGRGTKSVGDTTPLLIDSTTNTEQALPGGVVVTMPVGTSVEQALARLRSVGVSDAQAVIQGHVWMVPTASGLAALQLANRLHESGQFVAAEPNWWRKRRSK